MYLSIYTHRWRKYRDLSNLYKEIVSQIVWSNAFNVFFFFFFQLAPIFRFDRIDTITQAMKKVSRDDTMQQNVDVWREIVPIQLASLSY